MPRAPHIDFVSVVISLYTFELIKVPVAISGVTRTDVTLNFNKIFLKSFSRLIPRAVPNT